MARNRAFTLIEALVAVCIVLVLAALALPVLQHSRQAADRVAASSDLRQIGLALLQYASDSGGYLPGPLQVGQKAAYEPGQTKQLASVLGPYLGVTDSDAKSLVGVFLPPAFVKAMKGQDLNRAHPFLLNVAPTVDGAKISPFGQESSDPNRAAGPMKLMAIPGNVWILCDADQKNPGVIGQPWAANTPKDIVNGALRLSLYFDGSVQGIPASSIPAANTPALALNPPHLGGAPPPPPPPPPPPR